MLMADWWWISKKLKASKKFCHSGRGKCSLIHWATTKEKGLETLQSKFVHVDWFLLKLPAVAFLESSDQCHSDLWIYCCWRESLPHPTHFRPFFALLKETLKGTLFLILGDPPDNTFTQFHKFPIKIINHTSWNPNYESS